MTINNEVMGMKSGQVLILVLLTVIVVLTIGLSVASRNITNLRTTTQTEQSQRAFTAAEGGIESTLSQLDTIATNLGVKEAKGYTRIVEVGDIEATVNVKATNYFDGNVSLGDVLQIKLEGADIPVGEPGIIQIDWASQKNPVEIDNSQDGPASLEVNQIFGDSRQKRYYFEGYDRLGETSAVGFTSSDCVSPSPGYEKCARIEVIASPKILRIKPFWTNTTVRVSGVNVGLPLQQYDVTSTAQSEIGVTRSVQVTRSAFPRLPAVFDYALFSETNIEK